MSSFVAVVESGSFSEAARRSATPLATVSRRVADLEAWLRVQLLKRSTRKIALTDAGQQYFQTCRRVLDEISEAERHASGEYTAPRGTLVVSAPVVFGKQHLLPLVFEFMRTFPDVDVDLRLTDATVDLIEHQIDVAVRIGDLDDTSLVALRVGEIRHVVCASPAYLQAGPPILRPRDLSQHRCITLTALQSANIWTFERDGRIDRVAVRSRLVVNNAEAAVAAASADFGVTRVICYQAAQSIESGHLKVLLREFEPTAMPVQMVYSGARQMPKKLRAFLDFIAPRLKQRIVFDP